MKIYIALLLLSVCDPVFAEGELIATSRIGEVLYYTSISQSELQASSDWNPEKGVTPVGQLEALKKAKDLLNKEFPDFGLYRVFGVTLAESDFGTWHYRVAFRSTPDRPAKGTQRPGMLTYFILLNGESVSPMIQKRE